MQLYDKTVFGFFDGSKVFTIPVYQRAYSWEQKHCDQLLDDLREQSAGKNQYFLGHFLLETMQKDKLYEIIDGQQRLTTVAILVRAILDVLKQHQSTHDLELLERTYLRNGGLLKLRPVEYDRACFDSLVVNGQDSFEPASPSQHRMREAKRRFRSVLATMPPDAICRLLQTLEDATLTVMEFDGKKDCALMFELQNNRGKDLTNLEKLKSFLMYQMYIHSEPDQTEMKIGHIADLFTGMYLVVNDLKALPEVSEDDVLNYHCRAYLKGYDYSGLDDIRQALKRSDSKGSWIETFSEDLLASFANMKTLAAYKDYKLDRLLRLGMPAFAYPFILKGFRYCGEDRNLMAALFQLLEVVGFRDRLVGTRASIESRLSSLLLNFKGDVDQLRRDLNTKLTDAWYWSEGRMRDCLQGTMYNNPVLHHLLWEYEEHIQNRGYTIGRCELEDEQIEHVSPRTPDDGGRIAYGYELDSEGHYADVFVAKSLHSLGNLLLISGTHNRSIGNHPFAEKLASYRANPLLNQQADLKRFISGTEEAPVWDAAAIARRGEELVEFAMKRWSLRES